MLYIEGGESPQTPPVCSIHLEDATAAILHQNAHHTPANWWRGDRVMKPISVWGLLGRHDSQRPMGKFGQDAGVQPYSFSKDILGFLMTTESQDLGLTSHPKDGHETHKSQWHFTTKADVRLLLAAFFEFAHRLQQHTGSALRRTEMAIASIPITNQ